MEHGRTETHAPLAPQHAFEQRYGTLLSVLGLLVWLLAMILAVAGPLLGVSIPPLLVIGMVVFSGVFSLLSLPRILGKDPGPD